MRRSLFHTRRSLLIIAALAAGAVFVAVSSFVAFNDHKSTIADVYAFQIEYGDSPSKVAVAKDRTILKWFTAVDPQVSEDGRYVLLSNIARATEAATFYGMQKFPSSVYVYDVSTRKTAHASFQYTPAYGCLPQIAGDGHLYTAFPTLTRYQLPGLNHPTPVEIHEAPGQSLHFRVGGSMSPPCLIGHINNDLIGVVSNAAGWWMYRITPTGELRYVSHSEPFTPHAPPTDRECYSDLSPYHFAIANHTSTGDAGIALRYQNCEQNSAGRIDLINPTTGAVTHTDTSALGMPPSGGGSAFTLVVDDMWWGRDGHLYAIMGSWASDEGPLVVGQSLWRLNDRTWVSVDYRPFALLRQLTSDMKIAVMPKQATGGSIGDWVQFPGDDRGDLYVVNGHGTTHLMARHVNSIVVPQITNPQTGASLSGPSTAPSPPAWPNG